MFSLLLKEYTLQANFNRFVHRSSRDRQKPDQIIPKAHCPKFSKVKDEGWFLILGDPSAAELIALKRCSYRNTKSTHPITFTAPNKIGMCLISTTSYHRTFRSTKQNIYFERLIRFRSIFIYYLHHFGQLHRIRSTIRCST